MTITRLSILLVYVGIMLTAVPAKSDTVQREGHSVPPEERSGKSLALEGISKLMLGFRRMMEELPLYDLPRIAANGDIIIRRIDPRKNQDKPRPPEPFRDGMEL